MYLPSLEAHCFFIDLKLFVVIVHALDDQLILIVKCIANLRLLETLCVFIHAAELFFECGQFLKSLGLLL